ncbi:Type III restriction enzyme, res subunit [uncultured archaeon]|nr:Type III restriction enzyme, res subunit [uncultured archaeon]
MIFPQSNLNPSYDSDDDILNSFYIPVLSQAVSYCRLAGFFSSSTLAVAARGMSNFIKNNGKMKLIVGAKLQKNDVEAIQQGLEEPEKLIEKICMQDLYTRNNEFVNDHVSALGWMVANKTLEIKVAIVTDDTGIPLDVDTIERKGIFHQKVGILQDKDGNSISFSGSINETAAAWIHNIEEFKVFRSWEEGEKEYLQSDCRKFEKYWNGSGKNVKIMNIPEAVKEKLIEIAPKDITELNLEKWQIKEGSNKKKIKLLDYQNQAIANWQNNNKKGIFEMATGTGKTFTALGCLEKVSETYKNLVVIISCPYQHLVQQWRRESEKFGFNFDQITADSSNSSWKKQLVDSLTDIYLGYKDKLIIFTTHQTLSSDDFINIIKSNKNNMSFFLIGDEVHGLGAEKSRMGLINEYELRLGLSATPKRWLDFEGTDAIYNYFGDVVYEFSLEDAVYRVNPMTGQTYLTPYRYLPRFVSLTVDELEDYIDKTKAIARNFNKAKSNKEKQRFLESILFKRANILKNAVEKYKISEEILDGLGSSIKWTIIYCSPQQINRVMEIINKRGIVAHRFTMEEGTTPDKKYNNLSKRDFLLQKFAENKYQVLVAMKCLDEGVDVPPARIAILMASSGNPREYIQRIGRIIRRYPNKNEANIYDIVVVPSFDKLPSEFIDIELRIFEKELSRCEEIARIAINNSEALTLIYKIKNRLRK